MAAVTFAGSAILRDMDEDARLQQLINGFRTSQAIAVAVELGIPDLIGDGRRSSDDLAGATSTDPPSLYRLLRALAAAGVLHEDEARTFALTPLGRPLRSDVPESIAGWAAQIRRDYFWGAWGGLLDSVRTGETAVRLQHGVDVWTYRSTRPDDSEAFDRAMTALSRRSAEAVIAAYDVSRFRCIVDVGGGRGANLARILTAAPDARGILFDQPHVVSGAGDVLGPAGVAERCTVVGGSFFDAVPPGGDAYILRRVLHDWYDDDCARILRACRAAMSSDARLLVIEQLIGAPNTDAVGKFSDLNMLVLPGGRERTREEFAALFASAGLRLVDAVTTAAGDAVIEAQPA